MGNRKEYKSETLNKARIHEHAGRIALQIHPIETFYMSTELAEKLAEQLKVAAVQIRNGYHYPTTEINLEKEKNDG